MDIVTILIVSFIVTQLTAFATTILLHRTLAHRALVLSPAIKWIFQFIIWITTGMKPREWVAIHRKHHAYTDKEGDPHSPKIHGFWSVQIGNLFLYLKEKRRMTEKGEIRLYAADIKEDAWDRWLFNHGLLGVSLGTLILCILLGFWQGLLAAGLHFILYVFILSSSINGLCHTMGHKNYDNTAFNIQWLAYFTGGESLHNNHHGKQRNPKFSHRHGEVDPAWPVIRLLMMLGLAWPSNK